MRLLLLAVVGCGSLVAQSQASEAYLAIDAPGFAQSSAQQGNAKPAPVATGAVKGSVIDGQGSVLGEADVLLTPEGANDTRRTRTDADGRYAFSTVPVGRFKVTASAHGMTSATSSGLLKPGEIFEVVALQLMVAGTSADVTVLATREELASAELKVEEHQRLAGFLPNFFVSYDWKAAPLTPKQKLDLAWKNASDPGNIIVAAGVAGVEQAQDSFEGYGQGVAGYGRRFGAATGDLAIGTMLGGAVYPILFHQDPRYFYKGTGTIRSRVLYAISRPLISRGDNGKWQPAYASVLGDLSAGAITNLYYPEEDRHGAALTIEEGFLNIAGDAFNDLMQEFVLRHLTPHAPSYVQDAKP